MRKLLIVDDNEAIRRCFARALAKDFCITRSPSVDDALGLLAQGHRFDVILCDLMFENGRSGREFYEHASALYPCMTHAIRIFTGYEPDEEYPLASKFLSKVTPMHELRAYLDWLAPPSSVFGRHANRESGAPGAL